MTIAEGNFSLLLEEYNFQRLSRSAYTAFAVYLAFVLILSLLGNGLFIFIIVRNKTLQNVVNIFLVNICIADLSVTLFGTPFTLTANAFGYWVFGPWGCRWYAFMASLCGCEQIVSVAAIALQRYFFVAKHVLARRLTKGHALLCIGFTWLYSLGAVIPPAVGWNEFRLEGGGTACSVNWETGDPSYIIFIFTLVLVIPFSIIMYSYGAIILTVKRMSKARIFQRSRLKRADKKVTTMTIAMVLVFLTTWGPYAVYSLYTAAGIGPPISPLLATLPSMFAKLSTATNPIIYYLLHDKFRKSLLNLGQYLPGRHRRRLSQPSDPDTKKQALKTSSL